MRWLCCGSIVLALGCGAPDRQDAAAAEPAATATVLRLATTTSTRDSGLLDELLPVFREQCGCRVDVVAVGTGAALKLADPGDADAVQVHAPAAEEAFMAAGHGRRREPFMVNYFNIVGPPDDPAGVAGLEPVEAMRRIAHQHARFVSRGDDSGTHKRERALWRAAGDPAPWPEYLESGQGMGATLVMADEMLAYTLSDRGTFLHFRERLDLKALVVAGDALRNPYSAMVVDPTRHPGVAVGLAERFVDFLIAPDTQHRIAAYRLGGESLFTPTRLAAAVAVD